MKVYFVQPQPDFEKLSGHRAYLCCCDRIACMFCDGGLFACVWCGSFEGATTSECPDQKMTDRQHDAVYAGTLDYRDGAWRPECSPHTPAFWRTPKGLALIEQAR